MKSKVLLSCALLGALCAPALAQELPPADEPPPEVAPEGLPPDQPQDDFPSAEPQGDPKPDDFPADDFPADDFQADEIDPPPAGEPEASEQPEPGQPREDTPPIAPPAGDPAPPAEGRQEEVRVNLSYYPAEEEEFGPIDPSYRGPVELSLFGGWTLFGDELDLEDGGAFMGGGRFTINFGDDSQVGLSFGYSVTRINFDLEDRNVRFGTQLGTRRLDSEVSIHSILVGLTYRLTYLRWEYFTPYVRLDLGMNYFDDTTANGVFRANGSGNPTAVQGKVASAFGFTAGLALGIDYKISRNWSARFETSGAYWSTEWREDESGTVVFNTLQVGFVWHFQ